MFSVTFGDTGATGAESPKKAAAARYKKLIICILSGAVLLGALGGLVWYGVSSGLPVVTAAMEATGGGGPGGQNGQNGHSSLHKSRVSQLPPLQYFIRQVKAHPPLTAAVLVSLVVLVAAAVTLAVYLSSVEQNVIEVGVHKDDIDPNGTASLEEPDSLPVLLIVVLALVGFSLVLGSALGVKYVVGRFLGGKATTTVNEGAADGLPTSTNVEVDAEANPSALHPDMSMVIELNKMRTDPKVEYPRCTANPTYMQRNTLLNVHVSYPTGDTRLELFCQQGYTRVSIWRAILNRYYNAKSELLQQVVLFNGKTFELAIPSTQEQIDMQSQLLGNVPGTGIIPLRPQRDEPNQEELYEKEYKAWSDFAKSDQECVVKTGVRKSEMSELFKITISLYVFPFEDDLDLQSTMECSSKTPSLKALWAATNRKVDPEDGPFVVTTKSDYYVTERHGDAFIMREQIWLMYEPDVNLQ